MTLFSKCKCGTYTQCIMDCQKASDEVSENFIDEIRRQFDEIGFLIVDRPKPRIKVADIYPDLLTQIIKGEISVSKFVEELNNILDRK